MHKPQTVLAFVENTATLSHAQNEALYVARDLAEKKLIVCVLGALQNPLSEQLQHAPADKLYFIQHPLLDRYNPELYCHAIIQLIEHCCPDLFILPHSYQVRDFAPMLAARSQQSLIADCIGYEFQQSQLVFKRPLFQGRLQADISCEFSALPIVTLQSGCFSGDIIQRDEPLSAEIFSPVLPQNLQRTHGSETFSETAHAVDLSRADTVIAVGRGIQSREHLPMIHRLAELMGAEVAASRPVCDQGWLPADRQVGSSGQIIAPRVYIAIGISGAIQHIIGMRAAGTIVAINSDKNAPIFQFADYAIVGDLFEIVPALIHQLENA